MALQSGHACGGVCDHGRRVGTTTRRAAQIAAPARTVRSAEIETVMSCWVPRPCAGRLRTLSGGIRMAVRVALVNRIGIPKTRPRERAPLNLENRWARGRGTQHGHAPPDRTSRIIPPQHPPKSPQHRSLILPAMRVRQYSSRQARERQRLQPDSPRPRQVREE